MKKTLFITRHYLDEMLGGPNCSKAFIRAIAEIYPNTTLLYPEHNDHKTNLYFLKKYETLKTIPIYDKRTKLRKCFDMYCGTLHRFGHFVKEYLKEHHFDIIFIDHSFTASSGVLEAALHNGAKIVTFHHNVEEQYIKDNKPNFVFRIPNIFFALRAEKKTIIHSSINFTLTEDDKVTFTRKYPKQSNTFHTIGVFEYEDYNNSNLLSNEEKNIFIISGSLCATQTETATMCFLNDYFPILNRICPKAQLVITGRNPTKKIVDLAKRFKNITITPNPANLTKEVSKGNYYICPIHTGGGLKLRCLDALKVGLPIIAHKRAARGYESIKNDGFLFTYESKEEFATSLQQIMKLHNCHQIVIDSFHKHFSFDAGKIRIENILSKG